MSGPFTDSGYHSVLQPPIGEAASHANIQFSQISEAVASRPESVSLHTPHSTQSMLFNIEADANNDPVLTDPHDSAPSIAGSANQPDVKAKVELIAFNSGTGDTNSNRATLRFDFGQDDGANSSLRPVLYSIAAGLDLAELIQNKQQAAKSYRSDFAQAFSDRPIEVGGGLARLRLQVVRHRPPNLFEEIFSFIKTPAGKALVSAVGFPAIAVNALQVIDDVVNQIVGSKPDVLMQSPFSRFALSKKAKTDFEGGAPGVTIASLRNGFSIITPASNLALFQQLKPRYLTDTGLLPKGKTATDFLTPGYQDPFAGVAYAVIKTTLQETAIAI